MSFGDRATPGPATELTISAPPDSLAVAGEDVKIKDEGKGGGRKARKRREREAAHPQSFL